MTTTRLPAGITNALVGSMFQDLQEPRPTTYFEYFNDFSTYTAADWVVTETDAGATQAVVAGASGLLALQNTAVATDIVSLQFAGGTGSVRPLFQYSSSKDMIVASRFKVDDATLASFTVGLAVADTSPIASLPANGVFVSKTGATANPSGYVAISSVNVTGTITGASITADTFFEVAMAYTAESGLWRFYLNDSAVQLTAGTLGPSALLAPTIAVGNGDANARLLTMDWIYCASAR